MRIDTLIVGLGAMGSAAAYHLSLRGRRVFLAGGIAAAFPECIGEPYGDASGTKYLSLIGQPILIYGADRAALSRALERALTRGVMPAVYTEDMFKTTHDAANREVVKAVIRA